MAKEKGPRTPGAEHILRAFQKLWVAGTAGGFFTTFVRATPEMLHLPDFARLDPETTTVEFARYFYLLWFAAYFALSQLSKERLATPLQKRDLFFDFAQSVIAFAAVYLLRLGRGLPLPALQKTACIASSAIGAICILSLMCFWEAGNKPVPGMQLTLNKLRGAGVGLSLLVLALIGLTSSLLIQILVVIISAAIYLILLYLFGRITARAVTLKEQPWTLTAEPTSSQITAGSNVEVKVTLTNKGQGWQRFPLDALALPLLVVKAEGKAIGPAVLVEPIPEAVNSGDGLQPDGTCAFPLLWAAYSKGLTGDRTSEGLKEGSYEIVAQFAGLSSDPFTIRVVPPPIASGGGNVSATHRESL